ncbi:hypothetical protein ACFX2F_028829 [Malus domestica]
MRDDESLSVYLTKLFDLINQMRSYGDELSRERVVQKLLISLPSAYDSICSIIEHSKDLDVIEVQEVVASLKSFELRLDRHSKHKIEKAFASLNVNPKPAKFTGNQSAKHHKNWKAKGKKWDNRPIYGARNPCKHCDKLHFGECQFKGKPKCYNCDKFGHLARECNNKKPMQQLNYANKVESTPTMFYASNQTNTGVKGCDDAWYVDSGCINHMTRREDLLVDIDKNVTAKVEMGTRQLVDVTGKGSLVVETKIGKRYIKEVMLVPGLKENLLSVGQMMESSYYLVFGGHKVEIYDDSSYSNMVARVPMKRNQSFPMKLQSGIHIAFKASVCFSTAMWHRRLGHLNMSSLKLMQEQEMVVGLPEIKVIKGVCESCVLGKQCREAIPREATTRASIPQSLFKPTMELQSGYKLKQLRSDRGGEYTSMEFNKFVEDVGMERQLTTPYTPQQNGVAERKNRTTVEMAKCLMLEKEIPLEFWAEAVNTSVYILNSCPTKALNKKTPFEAYNGRKPGIKHLKVFGSLCYAHVPSQQRQKLDLASKRCILLGYSSCEKGYRLYNIEYGKVTVSRDVVLDEEACWDWNAQKERKVSIQITEMSEGEQRYERNACDSETQCEASEENVVLSSVTEICDQERMTGPQDIDHTPLKYRRIVEIYEKCNLCIIEPECFE